MEECGRKVQAALYMRLSREDEGLKESASISTQRNMLQAYAKEHGFEVYSEYCDEGVSGTSFDRPAWQRMIADIEAGRVNLVLTKDLSRLGRDYIGAGQYTELYFPSRKVRYIAVNDGYDSACSDTDIVPFKNVLNEMYARDASKKIKSAFHTKTLRGEFIGNFAPYGYRKDPDNKNHLLVDPSAAEVVIQIFAMAEKGEGPAVIAAHLNGLGILTPSLYRIYKSGTLPEKACSATGEWSASMVSKLLANIVYQGDTAQGKSSKVSFKSRQVIRNSKEDWVVVENTHEAIVSREQFAEIVEKRAMRKHEKKGNYVNVFAGTAVCADCGAPMSLTGSRKKGSTYNLTCGRYKLHGKKECTNHFVDYQVLKDIVLEDMMDLARTWCEGGDAKAADSYSVKKENALSKNQDEDCRWKCSETSAEEAVGGRAQILFRIVRQLYEDRASQRIGEESFYQLLSMYQGEMKAQSVHSDQEEEGERCSGVQNQETDCKMPGNQTASCSRMSDFISEQELSKELLTCLIERIEVEQGTYEGGSRDGIRRQKIRIVYKCTD